MPGLTPGSRVVSLGARMFWLKVRAPDPGSSVPHGAPPLPAARHPRTSEDFLGFDLDFIMILLGFYQENKTSWDFLGPARTS